MKTVLITFFSLLVAILINAQSIDPDLLVMEREIANLVNQHRLAMGLIELEFNETINQEARKHSYNMASGKISFSHKDFSKRTKAISDVMGGIAFAENVAYGHRNAEEAIKGWLNSPGHKSNIEGDFTHIGVGIAEAKDGTIFYTQIFLKK
jgi:uncharacterized protein YkwD